MTSNNSVSAAAKVPALLRFLLLNVEPVFATTGAVLVSLDPTKYVSNMSRNQIRNLDLSTSFVYTELAGAWLHFAFTEAVVLRLVDDLRVWRLLCMGMLLSDIAYCHSCAQAVGGWASWLVISNWTIEDWVVTVTTWPFVLSRFAIALGLGLRSEAAPSKGS